MFNPFTAQACKTSGLKSARIHACKYNIYQSHDNKSTLILCILMEIVPHANMEEEESLNFKLGTVTGHFQVASVAVKGLTSHNKKGKTEIY